MSILIYNGQNIEQRDTDGMVNLTQMAAANAVLVNDWRRLKSTEQYINQLSLDEGIPATNILTNDRQDGTWGHYLLTGICPKPHGTDFTTSRALMVKQFGISHRNSENPVTEHFSGTTRKIELKATAIILLASAI